MGRQVTRAASAKLWSVPRPPGTAQSSPLTKKEQSAYFPLNFTSCWTGFEDFAGIRHSESIPTGSARNFGGKGKGGEILEVHQLNKRSLQDHLTLWPKLMAKLEYVIPFLQPHSTATVQLPGFSCSHSHQEWLRGGEAENPIDADMGYFTCTQNHHHSWL